jgi:hypothetical protein
VAAAEWTETPPHKTLADTFSGRFRLASAVLEPRSLTRVDDGSQATAIVDALVGHTSFARPHQRESTVLGSALPTDGRMKSSVEFHRSYR